MSEPKPPSRRRVVIAAAGTVLVLGSAVLAVLVSLEPPPGEGLSEIRRLLAKGRVEEAEGLLDRLDPDDPELKVAISMLRAEIEARRREKVEGKWQESALALAKKAAERGDLDAAARALARSGDKDPELREEVSRELAARARRAAEAWDLEEAVRLIELAGQAWRDSADVAGAEMDITGRTSGKADVEALLLAAEEARARGDWDAAQSALHKAHGMPAPPELLRRIDDLMDEVAKEADRALTRQTTLKKVARLLDQGKVTAARRVLERYAKESGDDSLDAQIAALRDLEKQGGIDAFLPARRALRWLAAHQDPKDGGFKNATYHEICKKAECKGGSHPAYDPGCSGLALMAFTAFRDLDVLGEFTEPADRLAAHLVGLVGKNGDVPGFNYNDAIVTLALLERAKAIPTATAERAAAARSVAHLVHKARLPDGGWRYVATGLSDVSVTCWVMQALDAARSQGVALPEGTVEGAMYYLDSMTDGAGNTGYYRYAAAKPSMTASALLVRLLFGGDRPSHKAQLSTQRLLGRLAPVMKLHKKPQQAASALRKQWYDIYGWYYATYAFHRLGGKTWQAWGPIVESALASMQESKGHAAGSFRFGGRGGRLYATALNTLTLEAYYRHKAATGGKKLVGR